ncbi:hypothetical protein [uncultured Pseudacidovorax sp.]|uniref:hypothetical protein n=1 Tax=uncultured Pseudacidovorax sp. TaxID=679313 RepID=UPI0025EC065F|nr:hypothetical protein [uncultured Pseudacidovorax sp.]
MGLRQDATITSSAYLTADGRVYYGEERSTTIPDAYLRVESITGKKDGMDITVAIYTKEEERLVLQSHRVHPFAPDLSSDRNFFAQAYEHIKSLPEYQGATDA